MFAEISNLKGGGDDTIVIERGVLQFSSCLSRDYNLPVVHGVAEQFVTQIGTNATQLGLYVGLRFAWRKCIDTNKHDKLLHNFSWTNYSLLPCRFNPRSMQAVK